MMCGRPAYVRFFYLNLGLVWVCEIITIHHECPCRIYILLHGVFDPSPDLSPNRPYQPEPEGRGLILSEG